MRLLLVEDDAKTASFILKGLKECGYAVDHAGDGETGLHMALSEPYDAAIVDLMLPKLSGTEILRRVREESALPVIVLTAKSAEADRVLGLEIGADDYVTKPFSMRELLARVKAQLRRSRLLREEAAKSGAEKKQEILTFGKLVINLTRREVTLDESALALKPQEILRYQTVRELAAVVLALGVVVAHMQIGLLIAAKSILRFGEVQKSRQVAEYVIIGTLASFAWVLAVSLATVRLLAAL